MGAARRKIALQLALLVVVFALPVALSSYLYFFGEDLVPEDTVAMGSLIDPARPLEGGTLYGPEGEPAALDELHGKWTIVYVARGDCGPSCMSRLSDMDKVRQALGEDSHRARTLLLVDRPLEEDGAYARLRRELPRLTVLTGGEGGLPAALRESLEAGAPPWGRTFLIDPLGNLMMAYPAGTDPKWVLIDMRRLLKASQIG